MKDRTANAERSESGQFVPTLAPTGEREYSGRANQIAGAAFGVGHSTVGKMLRIKKVAPERVEEIRNGSKTVDTLGSRTSDLGSSGVPSLLLNQPGASRNQPSASGKSP